MSTAANDIQPNPLEIPPEMKEAMDSLAAKLAELKRISDVLKDASSTLQNYLLAKPKAQEQLLSNIDRESQPKDEKAPGELAPDKTSSSMIETLEERTIKGKVRRLLRTKQINEDAFFKEWSTKRQEDMLQAYANKGILGATAQMFTPSRIRRRINLAQLPEKVDDYIVNRLVKLTSGKEETSKRKRFALALQARRNYELEKKKKKKESLFKAAVSIVFDNIIDGIKKRIEKVISTVKQGLISRASGTKLGRKLLNSKTQYLNSEAGVKTTSALNATKATAGRIRTGVGRLFGIGSDVFKTTLNLTKSLGTGALYGGVAYFVFGMNPAAGIIMGTVSTAASFGKLMLTERKWNGFDSLKKMQANHGYGQYIRTDGGWDIPALTQAEGKGIKGLGRFFKTASAGTKWGTIGSALGAGIAVITGMPITLGATIGLGLGSIGGMIGDNLHTRVINNIARGNSRLLKSLAVIPTFELLGNVQTNLWVASQIDLIMQKYKGNLGRYLQENFFGGDPNKSKWENVLIVGSNWINLSLGLPSVVFPVTLARAALQIGNFFAKNMSFIISNAAKPAALASFAGQVVGTAAGMAVLSAMGVPIGAAAIIGSTIGAFTGMVVGAIIAAVSGGSLGWIMFFASSIGSFVGTMIGSLFDKAVDRLAGIVNVAFGAVSAFFHLLTLMSGKLDLDNLIMIVIALIGMFQAFDRMGVFESAYQCVDVYTCNSGGQPGYGSSPNIIYLANYEISIINDNELSELQKENLFNYLNSSAAELKGHFLDKKILINLMNDSSYEMPQMVILGLSKEHLDDPNELNTFLENQLASWAVNSIPKAENIQFNLN
jgi:hypothetical protein